MPIEATFEVTSWDEEPFDHGVGVSKLTRAVVAKEYAGDITGTSTTEWLMAYEPDKSATFVSLECIRGTVGGNGAASSCSTSASSPTGPQRRR